MPRSLQGDVALRRPVGPRFRATDGSVPGPCTPLRNDSLTLYTHSAFFTESPFAPGWSTPRRALHVESAHDVRAVHGTSARSYDSDVAQLPRTE
jgi:hypothetical protein